MDGSKDFEEIRNKLQNRCNLFYTRPKFERCHVTRNQKQMMNELIAKISNAAKDLAILSSSFDPSPLASRGPINVETALSTALSSVTEAKNQLKMMFGNRYIDRVVRSSLDSMLDNLRSVQSGLPLDSLFESVFDAYLKLSTILENPKGLSNETVKALTESSADLEKLMNLLHSQA